MTKTHNPPRRSRPPTAKRVLIPILAVLAAAAAAAGLRFASARFPRLEAAGFRISREEYLGAMYQARNDILSEHAAAGISLTDWHSESPLGDPCRMTMERALELLRGSYAANLLAVERGYLADAGYDAMLAELEELNRQRQEALEGGGMITGLPAFTTQDYLDYRASSLRLQFCSDPENPENQITEEALLERYAQDRDALYQQPESLELAFLLADQADERLEREFQSLRSLAQDSGSLSEALVQMPHLAEYYQEISVDPGSYSYYTRSHSDVLTWAEELDSGAVSQVFQRDDRLCLIQCLRRTGPQYTPLEDIRSVVEQSIRESRYDALIAERTENTEIRGDLQALYRFTAEQLP